MSLWSGDSLFHQPYLFRVRHETRAQGAMNLRGSRRLQYGARVMGVHARATQYAKLVARLC